MEPLPRPNYERIELDLETNKVFWGLILYEFDWYVCRLQSQLLYHNKSSASRKGLHQ